MHYHNAVIESLVFLHLPLTIGYFCCSSFLLSLMIVFKLFYHILPQHTSMLLLININLKSCRLYTIEYNDQNFKSMRGKAQTESVDSSQLYKEG